jgi:hypothetical protein
MSAHVFGAAYRLDDLRPITAVEADRLAQWGDLESRLPGSAGAVPLQVLDGQVVHGPEHALGGSATLCGIPAGQLRVARHFFQPETRFACEVCADADD